VLRISGPRPADWLCFFKSSFFICLLAPGGSLKAAGFGDGLDRFHLPSKLALNWLCFFAEQKRENLHNPLSYRYLSSFFWLCFFKLSSIFRRFLLFFTCFYSFFCLFSFDYTQDFNWTRHQWCGLNCILSFYFFDFSILHSKFSILNTTYYILYTKC